MDNNNDDDEYISEYPLCTRQSLKEIFKKDQLKYFQHRTIKFWHESFPALAATMTKEQIRHLAVEAMSRAEYWKGRTEREIWYYMISIGYLGFFFDIDPQYTDIRKAAHWNESEEIYFNRIHALLDQIDIHIPIFEKDWTNFEEKIRYIDHYYRTWNETTELSLTKKQAYLASLSEELFPNKWNSLSKEARIDTSEANLKRAEKLDLPTKECIIYSLLALYFGFAFERSPVFPWTSVLIDIKISPEQRVKSFIKNAELFFIQLIDSIIKKES